MGGRQGRAGMCTLGSQYNSMYLGCAGMMHTFHHHKFLAPDAVLTSNQIIMYILTRPGGPLRLVRSQPPASSPLPCLSMVLSLVASWEIVEETLLQGCQASKSSWPCHPAHNHQSRVPRAVRLEGGGFLVTSTLLISQHRLGSRLTNDVPKKKGGEARKEGS